MKLKQLFDEKQFIFSFEVFPPKPTSSIETIYTTLEELKGLSPDFISVTYGAGGSITNNKTVELSSIIKEKYGIESVAHLTCISSTKDDINYILDDLKKNNIENILALRGDIPLNASAKGDFNNASELMQYIRKRGDFNIVGACYPEGHIEDKSLDNDLRCMKIKEECGASNFISQLFFDNKYFYNLLEGKAKYNIKSPVQAGIMPVVNKNQIQRIASLCGATIPEKFMKIMNRYEHDKEALRDAGIAYAVEQIVDLISSGVDGIHLYTMNNSYVANKIQNSVSSIIKSVNKVKED